MRTSHSNYTGRMARSLTEAFGAHTSARIYPMGSDKKRFRRTVRMQPAFWSYVAMLALVGVAACSVVVAK